MKLTGVTTDQAAAQRLRAHPAIKTRTENGHDVHRLELGTLELEAYRSSFGAQVRIEMADGKFFEGQRGIAPGGSAMPFDERQKAVLDKLRRETR